MRVLKIRKMKRINRVQFTPDGARLLVLGGVEVRGTDDVVSLDLGSGEEVGRVEVMAEAGAVSADGERVAAGASYLRRNKSVWWRAVSGGPWLPLPAAKSRSVVGLAFHPDGEQLVVGLQHRRGENWSRSIGYCQIDPPRWSATVVVNTDPTFFAFDPPRGRVAFTGGIDGDPTVCVHAEHAGGVGYEFTPKGTQSRGLCFDAAGRLAVVNSKWVYVLRRDGGVEFVLEATRKQMNAAVFSPDGRRILTGAHDGALRVWDAANGSPVKSFDWQVGPVTAVAFAPDGLTCAAAGLNGNVVLWDLDG